MIPISMLAGAINPGRDIDLTLRLVNIEDGSGLKTGIKSVGNEDSGRLHPGWHSFADDRRSDCDNKSSDHNIVNCSAQLEVTRHIEHVLGQKHAF